MDGGVDAWESRIAPDVGCRANGAAAARGAIAAMHGIHMLRRGAHPIHGLPSEQPVANRLREEFEALSRHARRRQWIKLLRREMLIFATGQACLCVERAPPATRTLLWLYTWETIGDAIMDLAPRLSLPGEVQVDLCIAAPLADLFRGDPRFRHIYTRLDDCCGNYDFILLHVLTTKALRAVARRFPKTPFASMLGYAIGEQFDRVAFADARLRSLFGLPPASPPRPTLALGAAIPSNGKRTEIAVALGFRDPRRRYTRWKQTLDRIIDAWPVALPPPLFRLLGSANAEGDLVDFDDAWLAAYGDNLVGRLGLRETATVLRDCDAFLGVDGGLMHIALAADKPGLALFAIIDPGLRVPPRSRLRTLYAGDRFEPLDSGRVAAAFIDAVCSPGMDAEIKPGEPIFPRFPDEEPERSSAPRPAAQYR